jgi:L-cysteate sulfo-lyase
MNDRDGAVIGRVRLATWPTPLEPAPRLAVSLGLRPESLRIKRDDLTGLGAGGNKVRKLEWTVGAALAAGADTLVTTGAPQSNHARLTAAAAARLGLDVVLVLAGSPAEPAGNLLLDALLGATVIWAGDTGQEPAQDVLDAAARDAAERLRAAGRRPAVIPFGGSNAVGARGYRVAADEIVGQFPDFDHLVCAVGSGGTMAGLVARLGVGRVLGVHTGAVDDPAQRVVALLAAMGETDVAATDLRLRTDQVGDGYDTLPPAAAAALRQAAGTEGLILDPVYTARALAGLAAEIDEGLITAEDTVVFLASGGLPGLFGSPAAAALAHFG